MTRVVTNKKLVQFTLVNKPKIEPIEFTEYNDCKCVPCRLYVNFIADAEYLITYDERDNYFLDAIPICQHCYDEEIEAHSTRYIKV